MKIKTKEVQVFEAEDGTEFLTSAECERYEKEELKRWKEIKYFRIVHSADLTEGRGYGSVTYLAVESNWHSDQYSELFCEQAYGSRVSFVQGCSPMFEWIKGDSTKEAFMEARPGKIGDYDQQVYTVFLSNGKPLDGLPDPQPLPKDKR